MRAGALVLIFGLFTDAYGASLYNLIKALNTTQTIWLYKQNYEDTPEAPNRTCVRWHRRDITKSLYTFDNDYKQAAVYHTDYYTNATLSGGRHSAEMSITYIREGQGSTNVSYKLKMWDPKYECFILTRNSENGGDAGCELHFWHEQLLKQLKGGKGKTSCDRKYKEFCKGQERKVFSQHDCM
uniref:Putative group i salivary lipocalin n=1 Tax=Rhipicephalus pulchellus TaxID=72859 RepID=L7LRG5_RHIPC